MITRIFVTLLLLPFRVMALLFFPKGLRNKIVNVTIKFHKDKSSKGKHPHVIIEELDKHYVSVGLTTSPKAGDIKLATDPLGKGKNSHMKPNGTVNRKFMYFKRGTSGVMHPDDYQQAKQIAERAKQKHLDKTK